MGPGGIWEEGRGGYDQNMLYKYKKCSKNKHKYYTKKKQSRNMTNVERTLSDPICIAGRDVNWSYGKQ